MKYIQSLGRASVVVSRTSCSDYRPVSLFPLAEVSLQSTCLNALVVQNLIKGLCRRSAPTARAIVSRDVIRQGRHTEQPNNKSIRQLSAVAVVLTVKIGTAIAETKIVSIFCWRFPEASHQSVAISNPTKKVRTYTKNTSISTDIIAARKTSAPSTNNTSTTSRSSTNNTFHHYFHHRNPAPSPKTQLTPLTPSRCFHEPTRSLPTAYPGRTPPCYLEPPP